MATLPRTPTQKLALLLSVLLSPFLVVPAFCVLLVGSVARSPQEFYRLSFLCTALSIGVPMLYIAWNVYQGRITDMHVRVREQRKGVYRAGILGLACLSLTLYGISAPVYLTRVAAVFCLQGILFERINRYWKISLHTGVLAAVLACCVEILGWSPTWLVLLLPLIWARVVRRRHVVAQGGMGSILGYALTTYPLRLMEYIWG